MAIDKSIESSVPMPGVCHIVLATQYMATSSFMRVQEFYESCIPELRGHVFGFDEFFDLYAGRHGNMTYFTDWNGFNVPGNVWLRFFDLFRRPPHVLSEKEAALEATVRGALPEDAYASGRFYVVGTHREKTGVIEHEIAHALYYLDPEYRRSADALSLTFKHLRAFKAILRRMGYCEEVLDDEVQAHLGTSTIGYLRGRIGWPKAWVLPRVFARHFAEWGAKHALAKDGGEGGT